MYISIRQYKTDHAAEITKKVNETFCPFIEKTDGFIAYYAVESGSNDWTSVSIFETKEQAEASNAAAKDWVKENAIDQLLYAPQVTAGDIVADRIKKNYLDSYSVAIFLVGFVSAILLSKIFNKSKKN